MKIDLPKLLIIFVFFACAYGTYRYLHNDNDTLIHTSEKLNQTSRGNFSSVASSKVIPPAVITITTPTLQNKQPATNTISYAEFRNKYAIPLTGLATFLKEVVEQEKSDSTGVSSYVISKILHRCSLAPQNKRDLEEFNKAVAETVQEYGGDNGEVQSNMEYREKEFSECVEVSKTLSVWGYENYLQKAVDKNDPVAQYVKATSIPMYYHEWDEAQKQTHRLAMGKLLEESQQQCEPLAFLALSQPDNFGEGDLWVLTTDIDIPHEVKAFGNLIALASFYKNSVTGAELNYEETMQKVESRASVMGIYETELAKQYGRNLYKKYCLNKN